MADWAGLARNTDALVGRDELLVKNHARECLESSEGRLGPDFRACCPEVLTILENVGKGSEQEPPEIAPRRPVPRTGTP